jgi:hypothetical protein
MAFVLWLGAAALLIVSVALGHDAVPFPVCLIAAAAAWIGIPLLVVAVIHSFRARLAAALRNQLVRLEGPPLIRAMPPRGKQSGGGSVDHAAWGGIQGLAVRASRMASMGRRPWLRALMR